MEPSVKDTLKRNIYMYGREIDLALYDYLFENGSKDKVLDALSIYQNDDGGFGHGLEPDYLNPHSSPIQTWTAINILRMLDIDSNHVMVKKILDYLESSYDSSVKRWPNTIESNNDYPHAPWWTYKKDESFNPSISLASFAMIHAYPDKIVYRYAKEVIYEAIIFLMTVKDKVEVHELRCFVDMANDFQSQHGIQILTNDFQMVLLKHMIDTISPDVSAWFSSYAAKPSSLIKCHPSFGSNELKNILLSELHLALQERDIEGAWHITWAWDDYQKEFEKSKKHWRAIIALEYARLLKDFNMI